MAPLTDVRDISRIAYGFIASKALFAALNLDVFGLLAQGRDTCARLADGAGLAESRMATLLAALVGAGLVAQDGATFTNAPASARYLVRGGRAYFGDYYRFQIDRQMYPSLMHLDPGLRGDTGNLAFQTQSDLMSDAAEAEAFSRAQHAGSLGPALVLEKRIDLTGRQTLLDVAGGSGAFSITLCQRYHELRATILDFANVVEVARGFIAEADLEERIATVAGNAIESDWPGGQDVVLMSYLLSAVGEGDFDPLFAKAFGALRPGGLFIVHDFMLDDDRTGPPLAAYWFLINAAHHTESISFTPQALTDRLQAAGFEAASAEVLIPEITKVVVCRKPA